MATHHGGTGQPLERAPTPHEQDTDTLSKCHHEDMDNFENVEHENQTTLKALTRELDHLQHRVETAEGQPKEAINCWNVKFTDYPQHFAHQHCQNPLMIYDSNTQRHYVLPRSKPPS